MSAKYTIMLSCTRLHIYIRASLVMCVRMQRRKSARKHCLIQASLGSSRTDWWVSTNEWLWCHPWPCWALRDITATFLHISSQPHFDLKPDYIIRKPTKRRFQRYIARTEIFSTFHARVEYISQHSAHSNQWDWVRTQTHTKFHSVHLADIISASCATIRPQSA